MRFHICFNASKSVVLFGAAALVIATTARATEKAIDYVAKNMTEKYLRDSLSE